MDKKEYGKQYYQKNKERFRKLSLDYYYLHRKEIQQKHDIYCKKNRERILQNAKEYRLKHLTTIKEKKRLDYLKNRQRNLQDVKTYNQLQRLKVLSYYSKGIPKCNCCGERILEFLTVDHKNGDGSKHRKQLKLEGSRIFRWIIQHNYPDNFQILCFNCNCGKGKRTECPHIKYKAKSLYLPLL